MSSRTLTCGAALTRLPRPLYLHSRSVYSFRFTKFSTHVEHQGAVYRESLRGVTADNFERIAKNLKCLHLYVQKRSLCLHPGREGQGRTYIF